MKLLLIPVTLIEKLPHVFLYYDFSRKQKRYFLSPYQTEVSEDIFEQIVCGIIHSSDVLCALLGIDRQAVLNKINSNVPATDLSTTDNDQSLICSQTLDENRRSLSKSVTATSWNNSLMEMIKQKLNFEHRCMLYSTSGNSNLRLCALDINHSSSIVCNSIGFEGSSTNESPTDKKTSDNRSQKHNKQIFKMNYQRRQSIHQWTCIRDILNDLRTCNYMLKNRSIGEILIKIELWLKRRDRLESGPTNVTKSEFFLKDLTNIKLFKATARQIVWDLIEAKNEVYFPRPPHGRIPNFRHCEYAAENVSSLKCFKQARVIKINPSLAQEPLRYLTLTYHKILLTPSPALESVLFYKLDPRCIHRSQFEWAATKPGAAELGTSIQLKSLRQMHVDLVVVASVVVNPITGARIGKGKGYGDLEFAIMSQMGCVTNKTVVLTTCHESQLINDLPDFVMEPHDLPVDVVVTPERYFYTKRLFQRPTRVYWEKIDPDMMQNIPVLQELKQLEEQSFNN